MSHRINQVNQVIRQEISPFIAGIKDKHIKLFTVTEVETTPDLDQASVWVSVLTDEKLTDKEIIHIIKNHTHDMYDELSKRVPLKKFPHIRFRIDHGQEHVARVEHIFDLIEHGKNLPLDEPKNTSQE